MQAVIFAAGLGTRLRPLTDSIPKPLIDVGGKPILRRTLETLPAAVTDIAIVIGYKGGMLRAAARDDPRVRFIEQPELRGTYDALARARPSLAQGAFLALNGDDLYAREDLARLIAAGPFAIAAHDVGGSGRYSHLVTTGGRLARIVHAADHRGPSTTVYTGAALLDARFFDLAPIALPNGERSLPHTLEAHLHTDPVQVVQASFWMPVGTPEELADADAAMRRAS